MPEHITFTLDEVLIEEARQRAAAENKTLDDLFQEWLEQYVSQPEQKTDQTHDTSFPSSSGEGI